MVISVISFTGGVGKTTTSIHLAGALSGASPTLLVDGDPNKAARDWALTGNNMPFTTITTAQYPKYAGKFEHTIIDTPARPSPDELGSLADGSDLLIIPVRPEAVAMRALAATMADLRRLKSASYRILVTMDPPPPSRQGREAQQYIEAQGIPVFSRRISRLAAFQHAALQGVLVRDTGGRLADRGWQDYVAVMEEVVGK